MIKTFEELFQKMESEKIKTGGMRIRLVKYREACEETGRCMADRNRSIEDVEKALAKMARQEATLSGILTGMVIYGHLETAEKIRLEIELDKIWRTHKEETDDEETAAQV